MSKADETYNTLLRKIVTEGDVRTDRTGTGTKALFGHQMRFDLEQEFPLLTTKRVFWKGVVEELLWFLRGETNINSLVEKGVHIWDEWADDEGNLGPVYGSQWRAWPQVVKYDDGKVGVRTVDQIAGLMKRLTERPDCRRLIVTAWNPGEIEHMKLPPCHCLFQFDVSSDGRLSCQLYQRSCDVFLGVPFNIASYALLTHMVAHVGGFRVGEFIWTGGNVHIYSNHFEQVMEQLSRDPRPAPKLSIKRGTGKTIDAFTFDDFKLEGYDPHPAIKAEVAV